jgi:hypothetical protein
MKFPSVIYQDKVILGLMTVLLCSSRAFATITVTSPTNGSTSSSPVWVRAHIDNCLGAIPTSFGYSVDSISTMSWGKTVNDIDTTDASMAPGQHTIHFKSWSSAGFCPVDSLVTVKAITNGITVVTPVNGSTLYLPVLIKANVSYCGGTATTAFGYSVDNNSAMVWGSATSLQTSDSTIPAGSHTIHFKAWAGSIVCPGVDRTVTILASPAIPANASLDQHRENLTNWVWNHDAGTPGSSTGSSGFVTTPQRDGESRVFSMTSTGSGGEIFHASWPDDTAATHFVYENWFWINNTSTLGNLEMDMNQVMANGQTVIYGIQCDGYSKTWDYTINGGTPQVYVDKWIHSNVYCNPQQWAPNAWHHVELAYFRDASGNVTYQAVYFDGVAYPFVGAYGNSAFALGWGPVLLTNFQIDGLGNNASVTAYSDGMNLYRW